MMATKPKTWTELIEEIAETWRKWKRVNDSLYGLPLIENDLPTRSRSRRYQEPAEREVRLVFKQWERTGFRWIRLHMRREPTALENLQAVATAVEMARMAEVRGVTSLIDVLYRQMYPQPPPSLSSAPPPRQVPAHYALLYLDPSAPIEVCEAVYRKLAAKAHPDAGGDPELMVRLNAAIEVIRKEKESV